MTAELLAFLGVVLTAGLGAVTAVVAQLYRRLDNVEDEYRGLWAWSRKHLDLYYRYRRDDAPDPDPLPTPK